jgi:hypothetical protein
MNLDQQVAGNFPLQVALEIFSSGLTLRPGTVVRPCNPSYLGGTDGRTTVQDQPRVGAEDS